MTDRSGPPPTHRGNDAYQVVSAVQKMIRRGLEEEALFFALELDQSGYSAWLWRRILICASEDVGIGDPLAVLTVRALFENWQDERKRDKKAQGALFLTHAVIVLARAKKSRIADSAYIALGDAAPPRPIPDCAMDGHTRAGRQMGRSWEFFFTDSGLLADPETGELTEDGSTPDLYRERARQVLERGRRASQHAPPAVAEKVEQDPYRESAETALRVSALRHDRPEQLTHDKQEQLTIEEEQ